MYNHYGEQYGGTLEIYTWNYHMTQQPHSWGIYPDKTLLKRDTCTRMFIAAQPRCPSTDNWIRKIWYIHTIEYYSAIKKTKIMPFAATWMELETLLLSEISRKRKPNTIWYCLYLESNIRHKWTFSQKRNSWTWRTDLWLPRRRGREWDGVGIGS